LLDEKIFDLMYLWIQEHFLFQLVHVAVVGTVI